MKGGSVLGITLGWMLLQGLGGGVMAQSAPKTGAGSLGAGSLAQNQPQPTADVATPLPTAEAVPAAGQNVPDAASETEPNAAPNAVPNAVPSSPNTSAQPSSGPTYSQLLKDIDAQKVKGLEYDPVQDVARAYYKSNPAQEVVISLPPRPTELYDAERLRVSGVDFTVQPTADNSDKLVLLANLMLFLILIFAVMMIIRRSAGAANQAMSFGKSKARFQMEAKTGVTFEDVAGVEEAKEELAEVVSFLKQPEKFTAIGAKIPKGMLLVGPPGTGKTLLAKAIAGEAGVPFFSISGSEFVEMFVGVGASRVRDLFRKAKENRPCLIFIDEIDAVGRQRGTGIGGGNDEREQTLNQLLTEMDGFEDNSGIIIIAATNRPDVLDAALLRPGRFDRQVVVDLPSYNGRLGILEVHARSKKIASDVSLKQIARRTPGFSGADLANLLNEAAILTARRHKEAATMDEVNDAIDRITIGMTLTPLLDSKKKRLIAYHEVGHAMLMTLCKHSDLLDKVTIIPRSGGVGGFAKSVPNEDVIDSGLYTRAYMLDRLIVAMGGRAAEKVVFGDDEVTSGASSDIRFVTNLAREMVTKYGMSSLGPVALESSGSEIFLGRDLMNSRPEYSEDMAIQIDRQIRSLAAQAYEEACNTLSEHRLALDRLVEVLAEQESIDGEDFRQILSEFTEVPKKSGAVPKDAAPVEV